MSLEAHEIALIQQSFDVLREDLDRYSTDFYTALFRHDPELRQLFRDDLAGQGMKFMTTLAVIVENLGDLDAIAGRFSDLGREHASLGIVAANFAPMGEALIDAMRGFLGAGFTPELEAAWRKAYNQMAATMIRTGDIPES